MDTLLVWTLVGTTLGIVLLLLLLVASERELQRLRAAAALHRGKSKGGAATGATAGEPQGLSDEDRGRPAEVAALEQQLQSSQAAIASLQADLERLQAENAGLRHETSQYAVENPPLHSQPANRFMSPESSESAALAPIRKPIKTKIRASNRKTIKQKRRSRLIRSSAIALLLALGAGLYFVNPRRGPTTAPEGKATFSANMRLKTISPAEGTKQAETASENSLESAGANVSKGTNPIALVSQKQPAQATIAPAGNNHEVARSTKPIENSLETAKTNVSEPAKPIEIVSQKKAPQPTTALPGSSYEVVRSTRVFSAPSESSRPVARVEAGTEINVVGVRDQWLEVRSRHGRPSGFIRKSTAVQRDPS